MGLFGKTKGGNGGGEAGGEADAAREEGKAAGSTAAVERLKALEARYPGDADFARSAWERGLTDELADAEHYELVKGQLAEARAAATAQAEAHATALAEKDTALAGKDSEIAELKAAMAGAGSKPGPTGGETEVGDPVAAYEAKVAELREAGDAQPERTIAVKHPDLHQAYIDAVNGKQAATADSEA